MLDEFAKARVGGLRFLPISGGNRAGPFAKEFPTLTCLALRAAFEALPPQRQQYVSVARLDMCVYREAGGHTYSLHFNALLTPF